MKDSSAWWIRIPVIFFLVYGLMEYFIDSGDSLVFIKYPVSLVFMLLVLVILIAMEVIVSATENVMFKTLSEEARQRYLAKKESKREWAWARRIYKKLLGSKPVEEEHEIILDHNYDGIRELDNKLPPWWVYLFYITILFAVIYLARFQIFGDYNQEEEYQQELAEARQSIEEYKKTAKDLVDVNTVERFTDESDLKAGEKIFTANCAVCHKIDGGGGIGPNLTDDYWILGGGIKNVFHTISEGGRPGKGMISWKTNLKPNEIAQVASYVLTLHGTSPADPKEPQGELWVDPDAGAADPATTEQKDSTTVTGSMDNSSTE